MPNVYPHLLSPFSTDTSEKQNNMSKIFNYILPIYTPFQYGTIKQSNEY